MTNFSSVCAKHEAVVITTGGNCKALQVPIAVGEAGTPTLYWLVTLSDGPMDPRSLEDEVAVMLCDDSPDAEPTDAESVCWNTLADFFDSLGAQ